jgi:hypothetical protein
MSVAIKYASTIQWGSTAAGTSGYGKILSASRKLSHKSEEVMDENGELHSLVLYDQREEWDLEVLCPATVTYPALGAEIDLGSTAGGGAVTALIVMSVDIKWTAGGTTKLSITAFKSVA